MDVECTTYGPKDGNLPYTTLIAAINMTFVMAQSSQHPCEFEARLQGCFCIGIPCLLNNVAAFVWNLVYGNMQSFLSMQYTAKYLYMYC